MIVWQDEVPTSGSVELPPDSRAMDGLGRNHSLETALADLVDNSIDADATHVLIRIVRRDGRLRALYVVDNGCGMTPRTIDTAMTVGGRREYRPGDLGRFGIGMKAASFSQARSLTVMTQAVGHPAVGRRWELSRDREGFRVDLVTEEFADRELHGDWGIPESGTGTVIRWDGVTGFPVTADVGRVEEFVGSTVQSISNHLGLVFHRILTEGRIHIALELEDIDQGTGPRFVVKPLDPFGYRRSGRAGYPKELITKTDGLSISFHCHVWPGRSNVQEFKLPNGPERRQGLYIYRRDRLLHAGGDWGGLTTPDKRLQLARVAVDIDEDVLRLFTMNPEKSRIIVGPEFTHLAERAIAEDGTTFATYFEDVEQEFRHSRKRNHARRTMFPPGKGFAPGIRREIENEVPLIEDRPIDIRWKKFDADRLDFFAIDRADRTLWLNERYRTIILGGRRGGLNDAPIVKALLYLLVEDVFQGEYLGTRDRDNIDLWQKVLTAAARSERP